MESFSSNKKGRIVLTILLLAAMLFVRTVFYKTLFVMLLFVLWRKPLMARLPEHYRKWTARAVWICLILTLWIALPRWRVHTHDRVQLIYLNKEGTVRHAPVSHWLASAVLPESEIVNFGITGVRIATLFGYHADNSIVRMAQDDIKSWKIGNFFKPYYNLGFNNPICGVYSQLFNDNLGTDHTAVYICRPKHYNREESYPLVVFCHGFWGNWQLYQGIWKDFDNAIVLSIGSHGLNGIFSDKDIDRIFSFYIPALERMGYHIDNKQIHLIGLSNGGSAVNVAMRPGRSSKFKSITSISCNLGTLQKTPCRVNLVGGGKDGSAMRMPQQCQALKNMGVDAALFFDQKENHFILVNQRKEMMAFLKQRMMLE